MTVVHEPETAKFYDNRALGIVRKGLGETWVEKLSTIGVGIGERRRITERLIIDGRRE